MHVSDSRKKIPALPEKARALIASLTLSESDYHAIELQLEAAFRAGLSATGPPQCSPGPGDYLALDLGGTNYRVLLVRMRPPGQPPEIVENVYSVPGELMRGRGVDLFDFLAATIADFMAEHGAAHLAENPAAPLRLGFTFSFPCEQRGLASARLLGWTKGYSAEGVVGNDVCQLLQEAIDRRGLAARCVALVNDTVGTLAACALEDPACMIGLIVGTGTNAAYVERVAAVDKYSTELPAGESRVVINTEWGNFGADGCLERFRTDLDRQLDAASINPGRQVKPDRPIQGDFWGASGSGAIFGGASSSGAILWEQAVQGRFLGSKRFRGDFWGASGSGAIFGEQ
uniref:Phosphotransferase n=1 Tax=Macrostomum lignano TaxID=282301 RepID=A0A1I8IZ06_9PLAT